MWVQDHHFHIEEINDGHATIDCGVEVEFKQYIYASHHDHYLIKGKFGYIKKIHEIIQMDFLSLQCVIFRHNRWDAFDWSNVKEDHDSGIISMKTPVPSFF